MTTTDTLDTGVESINQCYQSLTKDEQFVVDTLINNLAGQRREIRVLDAALTQAEAKLAGFQAFHAVR